MILAPLSRPAPAEATRTPDTGRNAAEPGKDRDGSGEFDALLAALAGVVVAPEGPHIAQASGEADGRAPEGEVQGGGISGQAQAPLADGRSLGVDAAFDPGALLASAETPTEVDATIALPAVDAEDGAPRAASPTVDMADTSQEGGEPDRFPPVVTPNQPAGDQTLRVTLRSEPDTAQEAPTETGAPAEKPETANAAPAADAPGDGQTEADADPDAPDAQANTVDQTGRAKAAGPESAPIPPATHHPHMRPEPECSVATAPASPASRHETSPPPIARIAHQLAEVASSKGSGTVHIALSPEELGHVRLTIQTHDGGAASVHLSADRQDTLDLMRRHVELLAQDMRDLGYSDLTFTYRDDARNQTDDFAQDDPPFAQPDPPRTDRGFGSPLAQCRLSADGGLDIRI